MVGADIAPSNLYKIWIDGWSHAGSTCSGSSYSFLPAFLSYQQGMLIMSIYMYDYYQHRVSLVRVVISLPKRNKSRFE